jgi:methyl-accepting chemotaxis protein
MKIRLSVTIRLIIGFGLLCLFLISIGGFSLLTMGKVNLTTQEIINNWMPSVSKAHQMKMAVTEFRQNEADFILNPSNSIEQEMNAQNEALAAYVDEYLAQTVSEKGKNTANNFFIEYEEYLRIHQQIIDLVKANSQQAAVLLFDGVSARYYDNIQNQLSELIEISVTEAAAAGTENQQQYKQGMNIIIAAIVIVLVIAVILSIWTIRSIIGPIRKINGVLEALSKAKGDLSQRVHITSGDEIQTMGDNVNEVLETVENMVTSIRMSTEDVAVSSFQIQDSCKQLTLSSDEISASISHLSERAVTQREKTQITQEFIQQYLGKLRQVVEYAEETYHIAQNANENSEKGNAQIQAVLQHMEHIKKQNEITNQSMEYFQNSLLKIVGINTIIKDISKQTNLLSLNAGIEAARAGEHGKGFAVVASEIRKLSSETRKSSESIVSLLQVIQEEVAKVSDDFEQNTNYIEQGTKQMEEMISTFGTIRETNSHVMVNGEQTKEEAQRMLETIKEIVETFEYISALSDDQSASSQQISASAEEQQASTHHIFQLTECLSEQAESLKGLVEQFNVQNKSS